MHAVHNFTVVMSEVFIVEFLEAHINAMLSVERMLKARE